MLERIISGGQSGADQAGWRAAKKAGIPTGGWMPKGFLTEDGPRPEFAEEFGAREHDSSNYVPRTARNVRDSHGTVYFHMGRSSWGMRATLAECNRIDRPFLAIPVLGAPHTGVRMGFVPWVISNEMSVLNVAGNRGSLLGDDGAAWVEGYLEMLFELIPHVGKSSNNSD